MRCSRCELPWTDAVHHGITGVRLYPRSGGGPTYERFDAHAFVVPDSAKARPAGAPHDGHTLTLEERALVVRLYEAAEHLAEFEIRMSWRREPGAVFLTFKDRRVRRRLAVTVTTLSIRLYRGDLIGLEVDRAVAALKPRTRAEWRP